MKYLDFYKHIKIPRDVQIPKVSIPLPDLTFLTNISVPLRIKNMRLPTPTGINMGGGKIVLGSLSKVGIGFLA